MGSDEVDRKEIAQDWTARLRKAVEHGFKVRETGDYPDALFYDMHFTDFVKDQFSVVKDIYASFDIPMSQTGSARMKAFIEDNPKGKHGSHHYSPAEFGVDPERVRAEFLSYIERFNLEPT
jgi:hypothetical protein